MRAWMSRGRRALSIFFSYCAVRVVLPGPLGAWPGGAGGVAHAALQHRLVGEPTSALYLPWAMRPAGRASCSWSSTWAGSSSSPSPGPSSRYASELDVFGVLVLAGTTGLGGGFLRDVLIDATPPAALADWRYLLVPVLAGLLTFAFHPALGRVERVVTSSMPAGSGCSASPGRSRPSSTASAGPGGADGDGDRDRRRDGPRPAGRRSPACSPASCTPRRRWSGRRGRWWPTGWPASSSVAGHGARGALLCFGLRDARAVARLERAAAARSRERLSGRRGRPQGPSTRSR